MSSFTLPLSLRFPLALAIAQSFQLITPRPAPRNTSAPPRISAVTLVDTALSRMGGAQALRDVHQLRIETIIEWHRTNFDPRPHPLIAGYEWSTELRDYVRPARRYTRRFLGASGWTEVVELVTDSVATIRSGNTWAPQSAASIDERAEQFAFAPERVLLLAHDAPDAHSLSDTTVDGRRQARLFATVAGFPTTLLIDRATGFLAVAQYRAAQPYDFGLAPWGAMRVSVAYSGWQRVQGSALVLPYQMDEYRLGHPYRRLTTISQSVNPNIPTDSFAISDSLRSAFLVQRHRAMYDLALDSATIVDHDFVEFRTPGASPGAVKLDGRWVLIEAGSAPLNAERALDFLRRHDSGSSVAGSVITEPLGAGGATTLIDSLPTTWVTPAALPIVNGVLEGAHRVGARVTATNAAQVLHVGRDSLVVATIDLPDNPRTSILIAPSLRWAYCWSPSPVAVALVRQWLLATHTPVDRLGSARAFVGTAIKP